MSIDQDWRALLLVEYSKDQCACEILDGLAGDDRYKVMNEAIYYKDQIYLVPGSQLREEITRVAHDSPLAEDNGLLKTYWAIWERFTWKGLKEDVLRHVRECDTC